MMIRLPAPAGVDCTLFISSSWAVSWSVAAAAAHEQITSGASSTMASSVTACSRHRVGDVLGAGQLDDGVAAVPWPATVTRPPCTPSTNMALSGRLMRAVPSASVLKSPRSVRRASLPGLGADGARDEAHLGGDALRRILSGIST
jgi:hypothetical protein